MVDEEITIQLASGAAKIEHCTQRVMQYCRPIREGGIAAFELYDQIPGNEDDQLTVFDIWLANGIAAGIQQNHVVELWQDEETKRRIGELLARIPKQTGLDSDDLDPGTFENLKELFKKWMALDGWAVARVSKVLHKKRPLLVPPVDSEVLDLYSRMRRAEGGRSWRFYPSEAGDVVDVIRRMRDDIREEDNLRGLKAIKEALKQNKVELSIVRIFDIILWQCLQSSECDDVG